MFDIYSVKRFRKGVDNGHKWSWIAPENARKVPKNLQKHTKSSQKVVENGLYCYVCSMYNVGQ